MLYHLVNKRLTLLCCTLHTPFDRFHVNHKRLNINLEKFRWGFSHPFKEVFFNFWYIYEEERIKKHALHVIGSVH